MTTLIVSYPLTEGATFDREYYRSTHIPLARSVWSEFGLNSVETLFPIAGLQPLACLAILRFNDQAAIDAALSSPKTAVVIGDVANFTNISPVIFRADE